MNHVQHQLHHHVTATSPCVTKTKAARTSANLVTAIKIYVTSLTVARRNVHHAIVTSHSVNNLNAAKTSAHQRNPFASQTGHHSVNALLHVVKVICLSPNHTH